MHQSTKKKIAKEVIILFASAIAIGLSWGIFWGINEIRKNKVSNLRQEISILSKETDSIKATFPKAKAFQDIVVGEIPQQRKYIPTYEEVMGTQTEKNKVDNIRQLYTVLIGFKFSFPNYGQDRIPPFLKTKSIENGIVVEKPLFEVINEDGLPIYNPHFKIFKDSIEKETSDDTLNLDALSYTKPHLRDIYDFLVSKKKMTVSIQEFILTLCGMPPLPADSVWTAYQNNNSRKDTANKKLATISSKIYSSNELTDIAKWICIIVFVIVYPLRLFYKLLQWAIKTLKQN